MDATRLIPLFSFRCEFLRIDHVLIISALLFSFFYPPLLLLVFTFHISSSLFIVAYAYTQYTVLHCCCTVFSPLCVCFVDSSAGSSRTRSHVPSLSFFTFLFSCTVQNIFIFLFPRRWKMLTAPGTRSNNALHISTGFRPDRRIIGGSLLIGHDDADWVEGKERRIRGGSGGNTSSLPPAVQ